MSAWLDLPCGCRVNAAFVLGMCPKHAHELQQKCDRENEAHAKYQRLMRGASAQESKHE
jgi:hypothetical protein